MLGTLHNGGVQSMHTAVHYSLSCWPTVGSRNYLHACVVAPTLGC